MSLAPILSHLDHLPGFQKLIANLEDKKKNQYICGLLGSSRAYLLAGLYNKKKRPFLVVTSTQEEAEELREDISSFIEEVALFPSWEILPYELLSPHHEITGLRLSALDRLQMGEDFIVVAPVRAILPRIIPPQTLSVSKLKLTQGQSLNMKNFLSHLTTLGYERIEMVEAKGEFSVRGGIVDLYPATSKQPVRIEFFDEVIESIRRFDPTSQRSTGILNEVTILPRRELVLTEEALSRLRKKAPDLKELTDDYFEGIERYLPFFSDLGSIFDYLKKDTLVFLEEKDAILEEVGRIKEEASLRYQEAIDKGESIPRPEETFLSWNEAESLIGKFQRIFISLLSPIRKNISNGVSFSIKPIEGFSGISPLLVEQLTCWQGEGWRIDFVCGYEGQAARLQELLGEMGVKSLPQITTGHLSRGFVFEALKLALISDHEIFPKPRPKRRRFIQEESQPIPSFIDLAVGDLIVHINYGIGRYLGIKNIKVEGIRRDLLLLEYAEGDKLYVPIDQLSFVQKYIGDRDHPPKIYRLGGNAWEQVKRRVKKSIRDMAKELLSLYAAREALPGFSFTPDTDWQHEFEAGFRYEETPDQLRAIEEIKRDMEKKKPMDRLVCGDVGYGKTEVAIRAAFKAIVNNKQVAVLVPTTILAQQHLATFRERLGPFPINIEMLSRFKTRGEQRRIIERLKKGEVDAVIGTHRLLQKDVEFHDLGLVIVDEEQRFGVRHKEKLKNLRKLVDVLTLTATPIPRTLYMALMKARDMSLIETPPPDRFPIQTEAVKFDENLIRDAIHREIDRGGQVYFVHNRVQTIDKMATFLKKIVPEMRFAIAHGQMHEHELERVMLEFLGGEYDLLLSTSIIESGLDIPRVNTIIIDNAHKFGLAQLYQLRGRVGRANHRAYAYLLYPSKSVLSREARERLLAIREFSELGSGFRLAMRDMEIRGAGNILGPEQHGDLIAVGFDLYCRLMEETVAELKGEKIEKEIDSQVDLPFDAYIPQDYIPDIRQRYDSYKKISRAKDPEDIGQIKNELRDRYGPLPKVAQHLLDIMELRVLARMIGIPSIIPGDGRVDIELPKNEDLIPGLKRLAKKFSRKIKFDPTKANHIHLNWDRDNEKEGIGFLKDVLKKLVNGPH